MPVENLPVIKQSGKTYNISQLIDKDIFANENTNIYRLPIPQESFKVTKDLDLITKDNVYLYATKLNTPVYKIDGSIFKRTSIKGEWLMTVTSITQRGDIAGIASNGQKVFVSGNSKLGNWKALSKIQRQKAAQENLKSYIDSQENYNFYNEFDNLITSIKKGDRIGKLYSWVTGKIVTGENIGILPEIKKDPSAIWLQYYPVNGLRFYTLLKPSTVSTSEIEQQGGMTVEQEIEQEKQEQEDEKGTFEKLTDTLTNTVSAISKIAVVGLLVFVAIKLKKQSEKQ